MTTSTLTLTDFLLARIAEDRAAAMRAVIWSGDDGLVWVGPVPAEATVLSISGHRLLAECEAKRLIMQKLSETGWLGRHAILQHLALPYADHPEYREEWRP